MADGGVIGIKITGDATGLEQSLRGASREVDSFNTKVKDSSDGMAALANGLKSAFVGSSIAVGIIGLKNTVGEFTQAMVQAQIQVDKLRNGLNFAVGRGNSGAELDFIRNSAKTLGLEFVTTAQQYTKLSAAARGTSLEGAKIRDVFTSVAQASTVMGLNAQETEGVLRAMTQMLGKGKVQAEELRGQMGEHLPTAFQTAAKAMGVTTGELDKMLESGLVLSEDFLPKFARQLSQDVAPEVVAASSSMQASVNKLSTAWAEFKQVTASSTAEPLAKSFGFLSERLSGVAESFRNTEKSGTSFTTSVLSEFGNRLFFGSLQKQLEDANKEMAELQKLTATYSHDSFFKQAVYEADLLKFSLADAIAKQRELQGGKAGAPYVSGMDRRLSESAAAANADREAKKRRDDGLKAAMTTYATDGEKLNTELKKQQALLGDLYTPELEARIRKHFIKPVHDSANAFAAQQDAAKQWAKFYEDFIGLGAKAEAETLGLNKAQEKLVEYLKSPAYQDMGEPARQLALQAAYAAISQEQLAAEIKDAAKEAADAAKAYDKLVSSEEKLADSTEEKVRKQREQNDAIGLSTEATGALEAATLRLHAAELDRKANLQDLIYLDGQMGDETRRQADAIRTLADAKESGTNKKAAHEAAKDAASEWKKAAEQIESSITDALMRGFESGKGFLENLRDTAVNMFKTMVLRPVVSAVVNPVAGALTGSLGLGGAANAASAAGGIGNAASAFSIGGLGNPFTNIGGFLSNGVADLGTALVDKGFTSVGSSLEGFGLTMKANEAAINGFGDALGYLNTAMLASEGKWGAALGAGIGTMFGGPIGSAIGQAIGGYVDEAFGGGHEYTTGTGIAGKFSGTAFAGRNYQDWRNDGSSGLFGIGGASASSGSNYSAMDTVLSKQLGFAFAAIKVQTAGFAKSLGLSTDLVKGFSKDIRLSLGADQEANKRAISDLFTNIANEAAKVVLDPQYVRTGESAADTLARLATNLAAVNGAFDSLGKTLLSTSQAGGDVASSLVDAFGGLQGYQSSMAAYYQAFYTEEERLAKTRQQTQSAFAQLGLAMPETLKGYRDLVNAQDVATDTGRITYTALINLSGAFAQITDAVGSLQTTFVATAKTIKTLLDSISGERANVASAKAGLGPQGVMSIAAIRAAVAAINTDAPGTAALASSSTAAAAATAAADAANAVLDGRVGALATAQGAKSDLVSYYASKNAELRALGAAYSPPGTQMYFNAGSGNDNTAYNYNASTNRLNGFNNIGLTGYRDSISYFGQEVASTTYMPDVAGMKANPAYKALNTILGSGNAALSAAATKIVAAETALATARTASASATTAKIAADAAAEQAAKDYATAVDAWVVEASRSVPQLAKLREETIKYYESQKALADTMTASAANLRAAVASARSGQLDSAQLLAQKAAAFDSSYSLAVSTTGETQASYADRMASALPELTSALMDTARNRAEWTIASGKLFAQSEAVAALLAQNTPADYQAESLLALTEIDSALAVLDDSTRAITRAIESSGGLTAAGLREVVRALGGTPAFALGGSYGGGLALVGEDGPELINFNQPGQVFTAEQTRGMFSGGGGSDAVIAELQAVRAELASLRIEARATASHTNKTAKILERVTPDGNSLQTVAA